MKKVTKFIDLLKAGWSQPREAIHRGKRSPFLLSCSFAEEGVGSLDTFGVDIPEDVRDFWLAAKSANLFKDNQYGQWGMELFEPSQALSETARQIAARPRDYVSSDLVLGRFYGDSDLVVITCDAQRPEFGSVTIALPLDKRNDWPVAAKSFADFLEGLIGAEGDKYWE